MDNTKLTPKEWAIWAILGDPYVKVLPTLEELISRVETAIVGAIKNEKTKEME